MSSLKIGGHKIKPSPRKIADDDEVKIEPEIEGIDDKVPKFSSVLASKKFTMKHLS